MTVSAPVSTMSDRPDCACHGEPQKWVPDTRTRAGGRWYCSVKARESWRRWYWKDPIAAARRVDDDRRSERLTRMEVQLKEYRG
jgi:hypothetical protein